MAKANEFIKIAYAVSLAMQLGFLIAIPIALFLFLGLWLDDALHTGPALFIAGVLVGLGATGYEVYHSILPLLRPDHHA